MSFPSEDIRQKILTEFDQEQIELGLSDKFWKWIAERRKRPRVSLAELDARYGFDKPEETAN